MDRPVVLLDPTVDALAGLQIDRGDPEDLTAWGLQVIEDLLAVGAEPLVAEDLEIHGARVGLAQV
ncbi:hypothetical protein D3C75_1116880 [compost metagenome]